MTTLENINTINQKALEKVCLAQPVLNKIRLNPQLTNVQDPVLSALGEKRWGGHFVNDTLLDIMKLYGVEYYNTVINDRENIPKKVKEFVRDAYNYRFRGSN